MYNENEEDNKERNKENEASLYNYNMMFNKIGTYNKDNDKINIDTNFINDIDLRNFNPKRYEYYTNLIKIYNDDPEVLYNLLNKYNSIKYMKDKEKKLIKEIYNYAIKLEETTVPNYDAPNWKEYLIKKLISDSKKPKSQLEDDLESVKLNEDDSERSVRKELDNISSKYGKDDNFDIDFSSKEKLFNTNNLDKSIMKGIDITKLLSKIEGGKIMGGDKLDDDALKAKFLNTQKYNKIPSVDIDEYRRSNIVRNSSINKIKTNNKIEQLSNNIDLYNSQESDEKDKQKNYDNFIIKELNKFENDPKNPLQELEITFDDRIVFIIVTFFIRYVSLIMVQWCIDINIIKTFYEGFIYYAFIYIILFWFVVLFVNIDNSYDVKYMNFNGIINSIRSLFFYFYMGTNGISRLLVHTSLILLLIIIPIILNIKKKSEFIDDEQKDVVILNIEERKQLSKSLSLFTIFIWLFTSIIATKF